MVTASSKYRALHSAPQLAVTAAIEISPTWLLLLLLKSVLNPNYGKGRLPVA
jgi:hypothetical protein